MNRKTSLSRRTFLRGLLQGAAVTMALPPLEGMMRSCGTAWADGTPLPTRFGVWFWGNGVRPEHWVPPNTGTNWTPSTELAPLSDLRPWVSVVSGCEIKTGSHPHHSGMTGILTGTELRQVDVVRDTIVSTFATQSVDQIAADYYSGVTPYRSLEVGITRYRQSDEGTTFQHLSHNGPENVNPSEYSPENLYARLFGSPVVGRQNLARVSVLDAVRDQIRGLENKVSRDDKRRLEQHFQSVRTMELRLAAAPSSCEAPTPPQDPTDIMGREQIAPANALMSELLALALACDQTRVFSVLFSTAGSGVVIWDAGARNSLHQICHDEPLPQPTVHRATIFTMEQLATFLRTLRDIPEGDGNLLDRCSILCTTELTNGKNHSNQDFPILIAGKGGGRLRGNVHYRSPNAENATRAVLTALRGGGVEAASFGTNSGGYTGRVTEGISALET